MADRLVGLDGPQAREAVVPPRAVLLEPLERRVPALGLCGPNAIGQPQLGMAVAAVVDELDILAVGHQARSDLEWLDEHAVARRLVVEGESISRVADLAHAALH